MPVPGIPVLAVRSGRDWENGTSTRITKKARRSDSATPLRPLGHWPRLAAPSGWLAVFTSTSTVHMAHYVQI